MALWRVEEAAEFLGIRPKTLYEWVRTGRVPYRKIGFNVRFDPEELEEWTASKSQGPGAEDEGAGPGQRANRRARATVAAGPAAELREAVDDAVELLRRLEREVGAHLSFPQRQRIQRIAERLADAVRDAVPPA